MSELLDVDCFESSVPVAFTIVYGDDINNCNLNKCSMYLYQHIDCPTRGTATLDLLYTNVKDTYSPSSFPTGNSWS